MIGWYWLVPAIIVPSAVAFGFGVVFGKKIERKAKEFVHEGMDKISREVDKF